MKELDSDLKIFTVRRFANPIAMRSRVGAPGAILEFKAALKNVARLPAATVSKMI